MIAQGTDRAAATLPPAPGSAGALLADTWLLLTLRWQMMINKFQHRSTGARLLTILGLLALAVPFTALSAAVGFGGGWLLKTFPDLALEGILPGLILTAVAVVLLITSFGTALGSLFLSSDLELLMIAPVDRRAVFLSKLLDGVESNYLIIAVVALPALITYGLGQGYGPLYYLLALPTLLGTPLLPEGLGALAVLLIARFAPARRVREVLGLAAALFGISCSVIGQTSRFWFSPSVGRTGSSADMHAIQSQLESFAALPLPSLVAGRGLAAAGHGDLAGAVVGLAGFSLITFGFFAGCVLVAERLYNNGWVRMQSSGNARRSQARVARDAAHIGWMGRASAPLALALKDWRMIPRDLRNFAQLLGPLVMLPVLYFNLLGGGRRSLNLTELTGNLITTALDPAGIGIAIGILTGTVLICTQVATTAISMERHSWWLIKIAPITAGEIARGKYLSAWVPFAVLSTLLMAGASLWRGFSPLGALYGWFGIELLGAGILAMALGFGMRWPRLGWDNPKQMNSGWASLATLGGETVVGLIGGGFLCLPAFAPPQWALAAWVIGPLGAILLTALGAWGALTFGLSHLSAIGET